jgi:hypothetical protein
MVFFYRQKKIRKQKSFHKPLQVPLHEKEKLDAEKTQYTKLSKYKRTSLFTSNRGAVTVEASFVLPILICALVGILLWGKVLIVNQTMETALVETARQIARKEAMLTDKDMEGKSVYLVRLLFLKNRSQGDTDTGVDVSGISFIGTSYDKDSKEICLRLRYKVKIPLFLLGNCQIQIRGGVNQKAWNGYAPESGQEEEESGEYVYVTDTGTVYHTDSQCYHLRITIQETTDVTPYYDGKTKYRSCKHCIHKKDEQASVLYIPKSGDCYHSDPNCSGLTRSVKQVKKDEIENLKPCSNCSS